ncbi:hypothetical protein [Methanoculleus sp.]|nr:hypothetical protein [Methanoculleus sp.]MCK9317131.1 hypothetical protein [Methanoculleus sp.]
MSYSRFYEFYSTNTNSILVSAPIYSRRRTCLKIIEHLKAGLNRQEPVTITLGGLPSSKGGKGVPLSSFTAATKSLIRERYLYPNGSLIGFGHDLDGYLRVRASGTARPRRRTSPR